MRYLGTSMAVASVALVAACSSQSGSEAEEPVEQVAVDIEPADTGLVLDDAVAEGAIRVEADGTAASFDPDCVIAETGVAGVDFPATIGEFAASFPAGTALSFQPQFMVDFGSLCARSGGEDAVCVIFESYDVEQYRPDLEVIAMGAYADQCRTAEGVGPGTSVPDAVTAYGEARFGFSYENEGREYVSFADAPIAYSFRADSEIGDAVTGDQVRAPGRHGGDYTGVEGDSYYETTVAQPDAQLWEVWISPPQ